MGGVPLASGNKIDSACPPARSTLYCSVLTTLSSNRDRKGNEGERKDNQRDDGDADASGA
jgi:hypothetical protein